MKTIYPGYSIVSVLQVKHKTNTQILNQPGGTGLYPGKQQKSFAGESMHPLIWGNL